MSDEVRLIAPTRTEFGKGGARRTRRAGNVPAVIYGHGADPRHVALPAHDFANAIRHGGTNVLLTLEIDGGDQLVIPKSIQRHPIKGHFEHVDLLAVRRGEKVTVDVSITVEGDVVPGGLLNLENTTISVEAEATNIPEAFAVNVEDREIGSQVLASDIELPSGSTLITEPDTLLLSINEAPTEAELEAEVAEAVEELGIVEDAPDEETAGGGSDDSGAGDSEGGSDNAGKSDSGE